MRNLVAPLAVAGLMCFLTAAGAPLYPLVEGLDKFDGSAAAWELLQTNGFAVADPAFPHIYDPYLASPLPVFITADSAWHAYHVLLGQGLQASETVQGQHLEEFSRALAAAARQVQQTEGQDFGVISSYAEIGLALQDDEAAGKLPDAERKIVESLQLGSDPVDPGLGYPLSPRMFQFHRNEATLPGRAGCFAARQWYSTVLFRLSDARETRLALELVRLISQDPKLSAQWAALTQFEQGCFGDAEALKDYQAAAKGPDVGTIETRLEATRKALAASLPLSTVNDQCLPSDDAKHFGELLRGFRLLPPRHLPNWSGSDPAMLSRSISQPQGTSLMGASLTLLQRLAQAPAEGAPAPTHTKAWAALQKWTQLGAAAELHQENLAPAGAGSDAGDSSGQLGGAVAPQPAFFQGLAALSVRAGQILGKSGAGPDFEKKTREFSIMCAHLAQLAAKEAAAFPLNAEDDQWIAGYGARLKHFCRSDPDSDTAEFPLISRLSSEPPPAPATFGWLAQPQALYIILPWRGRLWLHCGAVLSFRRRIAPDQTFDPHGDPPPAPDFTRSFRAEKTTADLLDDLEALSNERDGFGDEQTTLHQLEARLTDADLPQLIQLLADEHIQTGPSPVVGLIAGLNWKVCQVPLLQLMETNEGALQPVAAILVQQPDALDANYLCAHFDRQTPDARVIYCRLLRDCPATPAILATLNRALRDSDDDVRYAAILALRETHATNDQTIAALSGLLSDTNQFVVAAAARALGKLGAAEAGDLLLAKLKASLAAPAAANDPPQNQPGFYRRLQWITEENDQFQGRAAYLRNRLPGEMRPRGFSLVDSLAEALGELKYPPAVDILFDMVNGESGPAAVEALDRMAPGRIRTRLLAEACNPAKSPEDRDRALQLLLEVSPNRDAARRLEPLLDDTSEIVRKVGAAPLAREWRWRLCDRAVQTIAHLLDKPPARFTPTPVRVTGASPDDARQWLEEAAAGR